MKQTCLKSRLLPGHDLECNANVGRVSARADVLAGQSPRQKNEKWVDDREYGIYRLSSRYSGNLYPRWEKSSEGEDKTVVEDDASEYLVFGLRVRSEFSLPELGPARRPDRSVPAVTVRTGSAGPAIENPSDVGPTFQVGRDDYLLDVHRVARYRVRDGNEIVVEPAAGSSERDVRIFLLGTVLGALCHQRGLLPLHASAIVVNGRAVAFAGRSRAGKSTLAAYFADRGYPVLSDDICVLGFDDERRPAALAGVPNLKLWQDALLELGRNPGGLETVRTGLQKYHVPLNGNAAANAAPLERIYVLGETRLERLEGIERLSGAAAFDKVFSNIYRRHLIAPMGQAQAHFARCIALLQQVPVFAVARRWGFGTFAADAATLERHFLDRGMPPPPG